MSGLSGSESRVLSTLSLGEISLALWCKSDGSLNVIPIRAVRDVVSATALVRSRPRLLRIIDTSGSSTAQSVARQPTPPAG